MEYYNAYERGQEDKELNAKQKNQSGGARQKSRKSKSYRKPRSRTLTSQSKQSLDRARKLARQKVAQRQRQAGLRYKK